MDINSDAKLESHQFCQNVSVSHALVDDQGDVFQCGKCNESFGTLMEFISHKREHVSTIPSQTLINNEHTKLLSQPSSHIWIIASEDESKLEQMAPHRSVQFVEQSVVEEQTTLIADELEDAQLTVDNPSKVSNILTCSVCQRAFKRLSDLFLHLRSHTGDKPFQCIVCGRTFSHKSNLKKHMDSHRVWPDGLSKTLPQHVAGSDLGYNCPYCQKCLNTYINLKVHLKEHGHQKVYKCIQSKCLAMFVDLDSLISHINISHEVTEYYCPTCCTKCSSLPEISKHQQTHHVTSAKVAPTPKYTCMYCHATFKKHEHLSHHLSTTSHVNKCSHCNKLFTSERSLRRHLAVHDESRNMRCDICGLSFKTKSHLISHLLTHSKEKKYSCSICSVKFSRKDILMRHIKIHQPNKKKPCPFRSHLGCNMEFTRTDKLNQHVKTHSVKIDSKKNSRLSSTQLQQSADHSTIEIIIVPLLDTQCTDPI